MTGLERRSRPLRVGLTVAERPAPDGRPHISICREADVDEAACAWRSEEGASAEMALSCGSAHPCLPHPEVSMERAGRKWTSTSCNPPALVRTDVVRRTRMSRDESQSVFLSRRDLLRLASASAAGVLIAGAYNCRAAAASTLAASCSTVPTLPQNDPDPSERAAILAAEREM